MRKIFPTAALALGLLLTTQSPAQDQSARYDTSGKGAVLCSQLILMEVRYVSQLCHWQRTLGDDAIDQAIADIDAFVIANSSHPVTQQVLDQQKVDYFVHRARPDGAVPPRCTADPEDFDSDTRLMWQLHRIEPAQLEASIAELLSIPREPLLNPCM